MAERVTRTIKIKAPKLFIPGETQKSQVQAAVSAPTKKSVSCQTEEIHDKTSDKTTVASLPGPDLEITSSSEHLNDLSLVRMGFQKRRVRLVSDGGLEVSDGDDERSEHSIASTISVRCNIVDELEHTYETNRGRIVDNMRFISTPLHVVKMLAKEYNQKTHIEHYILTHPTILKKVYRVDILIGSLRGVGQCTRKQLAKQLAAIDILDKVRNSNNLNFKRPDQSTYALLPGWRVDDMIYMIFNEILREYELPFPKYTYKDPKHELGKCVVTCRIGDKVTEAESDLPALAKKLAVKKMFEVITGVDYSVEQTPMGNEVVGFPHMKLLGFQPSMSNLKRKWIMDQRVKDTQVVIPINEPNDGDMEDLEEEVQLQQAKRLKIAPLKENLKITASEDASTSSKTPTTTRTVVRFKLNLPPPPPVKKEPVVESDNDGDDLIIDVGENETLP